MREMTYDLMPHIKITFCFREIFRVITGTKISSLHARLPPSSFPPHLPRRCYTQAAKDDRISIIPYRISKGVLLIYILAPGKRSQKLMTSAPRKYREGTLSILQATGAQNDSLTSLYTLKLSHYLDTDLTYASARMVGLDISV